MRADHQSFLSTLRRAWSLGSSTRWTEDNPACGQCGVTSLAAHDRFGGRILKTPVDADAWHFYNEIDGERVDFTASQFGGALNYADVVSDRVEAFADTNEEQYRTLRQRLSAAAAQEDAHG